MIVTKRSDELKPGDVFSTNGATVVSVVPVIGLRTGIKGDEICVGYVFDAVDGLPFEQRFDYVDPSMPVHVWVPDEETEVA